MYCLIFALGLSITGFNAAKYQIRNNLRGPIRVGILGNHGYPALAQGGFILKPNEEKTVNSSDTWEGRFWARTWCNPDTNYCETGDCGDKLECAGSAGVPPATLIEIQLGKNDDDQDFYDISLVGGFNVVTSVEPVHGTGDCKKLSCGEDMNNDCPDELKLIGSDGSTIGCKSSCVRFDTDEYCCRGVYDTSDTCKPENWPEPNSIKYFKGKCPDAYCYAYDDPSSLHTCKASKYKITFG